MTLRFSHAATAFAGFSLILALAACSSGPVEVAEPAPETTPSQAAEAPSEGTRDNPFAVGTTAKHSSDSVWTLTVGETDADAWPKILAANEFNQKPAEGSSFVTAPVRVELEDNDATAGGADPWASFAVAYVTESGNSFEGSTCIEVLPDPGELYGIGTMFGGAQADFLACAQVPSADIAGGTWRVYSLIGTASAFFAGAS